MFCDNLSAILIAKNLAYHERTKHLDIDCHFIQSKVQAGIVHLMAVTSKNQIADILTKALHTPDFEKQLERLGLISIH